MFTAFTTQLVSDEISFLLIAETELQATPLARALNRQGVNVVVALYSDVKNNTPTWQATKNREYYKLIWLVSAAGSRADFSHVMIDFLKTRFEPILAIFHVTHPLHSSAGKAKELADQTQLQVALVETLQAELPTLNLVLATDVVDSLLVPYSFVGFIESDASKQFWLDPEVNLAPQREEDVVTYLVTHLLRPHTTVPYLVRGKEIPSGVLVKKLQHAYSLIFGQERPIKHQPVAVSGEWTFTVVGNPHAAPSEVLVDLIVRSAQPPAPSQTVVKMVESLPDLPEPQLVPPLPPVAPKTTTAPKRGLTTEWSPLTAQVPTAPAPVPVIIPPRLGPQLTPPPSAAMSSRKVVIPQHVPPRIENRMLIRVAKHYTQLPTQPVPPPPHQAWSVAPSLHLAQLKPTTQENQLLTAMRARMRTVPSRASVEPIAPHSRASTFDADAELDKELSKLFSERRVEQKVQRVQHLTTDRRTFFQKIKRKKALFASSVLGLGISLGLLAFYLTFVMSYQLLKTQFSDQLAALNTAKTVAAVSDSALPKAAAIA